MEIPTDQKKHAIIKLQSDSYKIQRVGEISHNFIENGRWNRSLLLAHTMEVLNKVILLQIFFFLKTKAYRRKLSLLQITKKLYLNGIYK